MSPQDILALCLFVGAGADAYMGVTYNLSMICSESPTTDVMVEPFQAVRVLLPMMSENQGMCQLRLHTEHSMLVSVVGESVRRGENRTCSFLYLFFPGLKYNQCGKIHDAPMTTSKMVTVAMDYNHVNHPNNPQWIDPRTGEADATAAYTDISYDDAYNDDTHFYPDVELLFVAYLEAIDGECGAKEEERNSSMLSHGGYFTILSWT